MRFSRRALLRTSLAAGTTLAAPRLAMGQTSTLRFVPQADLTVVDPIWTTATVTNTHALLVFDTLYGLDADYAPRPQMVAGHVVEEDGRRWTMTLRDGLRFHDGEPVRARDVVASLRRWGARDMFGQEVMAISDEIAAPDDRTVVFRLKRAFPALPAALGKVDPSHAVIMPERLAATDPSKQVTEVVGSGPYRFLAGERVVGSRTVYAKFDGYVPRPGGAMSRSSGPKVGHFDRIEWRVMPDQATGIAALQAGEVDWLDTMSSDLLPLVRRDRRLKAECVDDRYHYMLRFNLLHPPFDNPAIRRALLGAVDQTDFMTAAFGDNEKAWRTKVGFFRSESAMASEAGMDVLTSPRDPERVKRELVAAGYKGETVVILQPEDFPSLRALTEVASDMLRRVGMKVDTQSGDWGTVIQRRASREAPEKGGWNLFVTGTTTAGDPAGHLGLRGNGTKAWFGWPDNPRLEELRSAWFAAPDLAAQKAICREMQVQAFRDVPHLPLGDALRLTAYRTELSGFTNGMVNFFGVKRG